MPSSMTHRRSIPMEGIPAIAQVAHALSSAHNLEIMMLIEEAPAFAGDLASALDYDAAKLEDELRYLASLGLVLDVREQDETWYKFAGPHAKELLTSISNFVAKTIHTR